MDYRGNGEAQVHPMFPGNIGGDSNGIVDAQRDQREVYRPFKIYLSLRLIGHLMPNVRHAVDSSLKQECPKCYSTHDDHQRIFHDRNGAHRKIENSAEASATDLSFI